MPPQPFIPGLVSITFRKLPAEEIIHLAVETGLKSIEWGGDIHVPHGELATAARIRRLCSDNNIAISAYGSYYRAAISEHEGVHFSSILETAQALGTDSIRVWAGNIASADAPADFHAAVVADLKRICELAAKANCSVSLEFHGGTLTDIPEGTLRLISDIAAPNLTTYWQPPNGMSPENCLSGLKSVLPHVKNIHMFHWWPDAHYRLPLANGTDRWRQYLKLAASVGTIRHASLEFVRGDDADQFRADVKTFQDLLKSVVSV